MKFLIPIVLLLGILTIWMCWEPAAEVTPVKTAEATPTETLLNPVGKTAAIGFDAMPEGYSELTESAGVFARPLNSSVPAEGSKLFEIVAESGVTFSNDALTEGKNIYNESGSGLAIGDFDNDGLNDIYFSGADVSNRLYRNLGDMKFEDVTEVAGVNGQVDGNHFNGSGATFADVDNDGFLDLFVCNMFGPTLLYMNQGDGTFVEQAKRRGVDYFGAGKVGAFCDYDRDGDLDLYLLTYQDENVEDKPKVTPSEYYALLHGKVVRAGERDVFYRNNGDGTFENFTSQAGIEGFDPGLAVQWLDYDGDGWQDIYVTSDFQISDRLYRNLGNGRFEDVLPKTVTRTPWFSMGADSGDLNGDGMPDLIVGDMAGSSHFRQKVDMGEMQGANWFLSAGKPRQAMKNCVFVNSGTKSFFEVAAQAGLASTDWTWAVRIVDMDNDGKQDLFMTTGHARDSMNSDLLAANKGLSPDDPNYKQLPPRKEKNRAFQNLGGLNFEDVAAKWGLDNLGISHGAAFSDLDNDGDQDLVVNNYYEQALVYRNNASENACVTFEFRCNDNNFYGVGTKIEILQGDQRQSATLQPTRGYISSDAPQLHFGVKDTTIDAVDVYWPDGTRQQFTNFQPNQLYRIVESTEREKTSPSATPGPQFVENSIKRAANFVHKERPFDDYRREELLPFQLSQLGGGVAWGDVNGDQLPDLFCGGAAGQPGTLFVNSESGRFKKAKGPWEQHGVFEDMGVLFFDADGDGDDDLYIASGSNECNPGDKLLIDRLYINNGQLKFSVAPVGTLPQLFNSGSTVTAGDYDRDGDLDLFVGSRSVPGSYPITPKSTLLENRDGKFVDVTDEVAEGLGKAGLINSAIWSDFDSDGWPDLIVAAEWAPVTVFQNESGTLVNRTKELGLDGVTGWWRGIERGDFDDDGDLDYIVTNQGTNTKYHTSPEHPHRLYYGDFDSNGTLDLVEAEYEGETEYPVRGRSCSSHCMPFIAKKFENFEGFAMASLTDIYEPSIHEKDFREVTELRTSILWNEGSKFRIEPMEAEVQLSPTFSAAAADFDLDGFEDIFLANNFFASQPETGYMDGGMSLLVQGRAKGKFQPIWPKKSGVSINNASYAAAVADFDRDGDVDIAVGVNNGKMKLLENQNSDGKSVRLELPANSVGIQLILRGPNFQRRIEVGSNNGYLAQSWPREVLISKALVEKIQEVVVLRPGKESATVKFQPEDDRFAIAP